MVLMTYSDLRTRSHEFGLGCPNFADGIGTDAQSP